MSDILVVNGEIIWNHDDIYIISGDENIRQQAYLRSTCDLGESGLSQSYGSDIFKQLGKPDLTGLEKAAREAINMTPGVAEIMSINCRIENPETASVRAEIKTEEGNVIFAEI